MNITRTLIDVAAALVPQSTPIATGGGCDYIHVMGLGCNDFVLGCDDDPSSPETLTEQCIVVCQQNHPVLGMWHHGEVVYCGSTLECLTFLAKQPAVTRVQREIDLAKVFAVYQADLDADEQQTFIFEEDHIENPWRDPTGRFEVDPARFYGMAFVEWFDSVITTMEGNT